VSDVIFFIVVPDEIHASLFGLALGEWKFAENVQPNSSLKTIAVQEVRLVRWPTSPEINRAALRIRSSKSKKSAYRFVVGNLLPSPALLAAWLSQGGEVRPSNSRNLKSCIYRCRNFARLWWFVDSERASKAL